MSIFQSVTKPSQVVRAMIDGLDNHCTRSDFEVNMDVFLEKLVYKNLCVGCAATCAIQQVMNKEITRDDLVRGEDFDLKLETNRFDLYSHVFHTDHNETNEIMLFESLVEHLRTGDVFGLLQFYECKQEDIDNILDSWNNHLPVLTTRTWEDHLKSYELFAKDLEEMNL